MAKKSVKKSTKSKLSKSNSKKAQTRNSSKAKKQISRSKASSPVTKAKKQVITEKKAKAKKKKTELKKPSTVSKKKSLSKSNPIKTKSKPKSKGISASPSLQEIQEGVLKNVKKLNKHNHSENFQANTGKASGKKHLNLKMNENQSSGIEPHNNKLTVRPEIYEKRGRSTSPRATFPTK